MVGSLKALGGAAFLGAAAGGAICDTITAQWIGLAIGVATGAPWIFWPHILAAYKSARGIT